jgi:hypothetical protein
MTSASFVRRRLDLTIQLGTGEFGDSVGDTVTLTGLRMMADIVYAGGDSMGVLQLRVFGLPQAMMNRLTTIGPVATAIRSKNSILLAAGDDVNGMKMAYQGTIDQAWADYSNIPDVPFNVVAYAGLAAAVKPVDAISFKGSADVAEIMSGLAQTMGLAFEANSVSAKLSNPYFPGTALMQVKACATAANVRWSIDRGTLSIWPKESYQTSNVPLISPETGLVSSPVLSSKGMSLTMIYNTNVRLPGKIEVKSSIPMACGIQNVATVSHSLSSEMQGGPWFTNVECYPDGS